MAHGCLFSLLLMKQERRKEKLPASPEGKWKTSLADLACDLASWHRTQRTWQLGRIVPRNTRIFQGRSGASGRLGEIPGSTLLDGGLIKKRGHLPPASQQQGAPCSFFFVPPFRAFDNRPAEEATQQQRVGNGFKDRSSQRRY